MTTRPLETKRPAALLDLDYSDGEGMVVTSPGPGSATGQAFSERSIADATLDAEVGLLEGEAEDRFGLFFRQTAPERYLACTLSAAGHLSLGAVDGGPPLIIAERQLDPLIHFQGSLGNTTRITIVACGPVAAVIVNEVTVLGAVLDSRYVAGRVGALLVHTSSSPRARLAVRWAQARAFI